MTFNYQSYEKNSNAIIKRINVTIMLLILGAPSHLADFKSLYLVNQSRSLRTFSPILCHVAFIIGGAL